MGDSKIAKKINWNLRNTEQLSFFFSDNHLFGGSDAVGKKRLQGNNHAIRFWSYSKNSAFLKKKKIYREFLLFKNNSVCVSGCDRGKL